MAEFRTAAGGAAFRVKQEMVDVSSSRCRHCVVLVLLALLMTGAGCADGPSSVRGDGRSALPTGSTRAPSPTTGAPQPAKQCGKPTTQAEPFWLSAGEAWLQAATIGTGSDTAIFIHESGTQGLCGFWPYAEWLATQGVRSVLFNQCTYGASECAAIKKTEEWVTATDAAVAWARDHGTRRVTVVGASVGGIVALHAAASIKPPVDAVVNLSGELSWSGLDAITAAQQLKVPALFAVAPGDRYVTIDDMRSVYQAVAADPKRLVILPTGAGHGWQMLSDPAGSGWSPLAETVAAWIHGNHS
jgi:Dienelactone hydrolase family